MSMDPRAAKGIAGNIRTIAVMTTHVVLIDSKGGEHTHEECCARVRCVREIEKAEARIASWLTQPMTWR